MEKIKSLVSWWGSEGCKSNDINTLLTKQGELAGYSFYLAEFVGQKHTEFIMAEHNRKVSYNMEIQARMNDGATKGASEVGAGIKTAEMQMKTKPTNSGKYSERKAKQDHWKKRIRVLFKNGKSAPEIAKILGLTYNYVSVRMGEIIMDEMRLIQRLKQKPRERTAALYGKQEPYYDNEDEYGLEWQEVDFFSLSWAEKVIYLNPEN